MEIRAPKIESAVHESDSPDQEFLEVIKRTIENVHYRYSDYPLGNRDLLLTTYQVFEILTLLSTQVLRYIQEQAESSDLDEDGPSRGIV